MLISVSGCVRNPRGNCAKNTLESSQNAVVVTLVVTVSLCWCPTKFKFSETKFRKTKYSINTTAVQKKLRIVWTYFWMNVVETIFVMELPKCPQYVSLWIKAAISHCWLQYCIRLPDWSKTNSKCADNSHNPQN